MTTGIARRKATNFIIVHAALTYPTQPCDARIIAEWHIKKGWSAIGYHYVIRRDGIIELGRPADRVGAHCLGRNHDSIGIVLAGGIDHALNTNGGTGTSLPRYIKAATGFKNAAIAANYTPAQLVSLRNVIELLLTQHPDAVVMGHRDAVADSRPCPCFNVPDWFANGMAPRVTTSLKGDPTT